MKNVIVLSSFLFLSLISITRADNNYSYRIMSENEFESVVSYNAEDREIVEEMRSQIEVNGYYDTYSEAAVLLRDVKNRRAKGFIDVLDDPYYENLRASPSEFPMIFSYKGISTVDKTHLLGYVPSGISVREKPGSSVYVWSGVTGYFLDDKFGECRHVVDRLTNPVTGSWYSKVDYDPKYTTYEINNKPTTKSAEGNLESGYIYEIKWTGKHYDKELDCSNTKPFDSQAIKDLIEYAKKIDGDLPDSP